MSGGWRSQAACKGSADLFFGPDDETAQERRARAANARRICAGCPVRLECHTFAQVRDLQFGVWGGEDFERSRKRMCRNGLHLMDIANTWIDSAGHRNCRACRNAADRRARQEGRAA
jgi:WhiB family transcriptional regulator, redox-sensing transcriptional regulator